MCFTTFVIIYNNNNNQQTYWKTADIYILLTSLSRCSYFSTPRIMSQQLCISWLCQCHLELIMQVNHVMYNQFLAMLTVGNVFSSLHSPNHHSFWAHQRKQVKYLMYSWWSVSTCEDNLWILSVLTHRLLTSKDFAFTSLVCLCGHLNYIKFVVYILLKNLVYLYT